MESCGVCEYEYVCACVCVLQECVAMTRCLWQAWLVLGLGVDYDMQGEKRIGPKKKRLCGRDGFAMFCDVVYEDVCVCVCESVCASVWHLVVRVSPVFASNKRVKERGCQQVRRRRERERVDVGNMYEKRVQCKGG